MDWVPRLPRNVSFMVENTYPPGTTLDFSVDPPHLITPVTEPGEILFDPGVPDRLGIRIRLQVPLGHIGLLIGGVHQHPIPGLILRGTTSGYLPVPFLGQAELRIHVIDHAAITEKFVVYQLTYVPLCLFH
jgi:hypothetical protein